MGAVGASRLGEFVELLGEDRQLGAEPLTQASANDGEAVSGYGAVLRGYE